MYKESFERDMSGLEVRAKGEKFNSFVIDKLEDGSPGDAAGLKAGDEIIALNGKMTSTLRLSDILKTFQRGEGKEIRIFVKRGNEFLFTSFFLKRMI
jgi:C-terminal processing protease CtpA/Prc